MKLRLLEVLYYGYDMRLHRGQIVVHIRAEDDVQSFFALARNLMFPIEKVIPISAPKYMWDDERSCNDNNSSGYNYRTVIGTNIYSKHAYGLAFDINPRENVCIRYDLEGNEVYRSPKNAVYDVTITGTLTKDHPLVLHMTARGWVWGGEWTKESGRVDYQHFEKK